MVSTPLDRGGSWTPQLHDISKVRSIGRWSYCDAAISYRSVGLRRTPSRHLHTRLGGFRCFEASVRLALMGLALVDWLRRGTIGAGSAIARTSSSSQPAPRF